VEVVIWFVLGFVATATLAVVTRRRRRFNRRVDEARLDAAQVLSAHAHIMRQIR
jgi:hypothetical protein